MKTTFFLFLFLFFCSLIYGQEFRISNYFTQSFVADKFDNAVYWSGATPDGVKNFKTIIPSLETEIVDIMPLAFFNKSHKCLYQQNDSIYFYDFNTQESTFFNLKDSVGYQFLVSPNDESVLYGNSYYNIANDTVINIGSQAPLEDTQWSSDSSIILLDTGNGGIIREYFPLSGFVDTLSSPNDEIEYISSISYNIRTNNLAYGLILNTSGWGDEIRNLNLKTGIDSILIDNSMLGVPCNTEALIFKSLNWSEKNKLEFITFSLTISGSGVNVYYPDSSYLHIYEDCDHVGLKYNAQWLNENIVIYSDDTRKAIYGYDVTSPLSVKAFNDNLPVDFDLTNYPNPFNSSTNFRFALPGSGLGILTIYDITGQEIFKHKINNKTKGNMKYTWDGKSSSNQQLSSGIYFVQLNYQLEQNQRLSKTIKIVYLK